jgi:hypothetical protein
MSYEGVQASDPIAQGDAKNARRFDSIEQSDV